MSRLWVDRHFWVSDLQINRAGTIKKFHKLIYNHWQNELLKNMSTKVWHLTIFISPSPSPPPPIQCWSAMNGNVMRSYREQTTNVFAIQHCLGEGEVDECWPRGWKYVNVGFVTTILAMIVCPGLRNIFRESELDAVPIINMMPNQTNLQEKIQWSE